MALYGRMLNGILVLNNQAAYDAVHPDFQHLWAVVPDGTKDGSTKNPDGTFAPPPAAPPPVVTPMQFYISFTPAERIAIKASTDPMVKEFWATYELAAQTNTPINLGLVSVTGGINYMATPSPGVALLAPPRVAQILAGIPQ